MTANPRITMVGNTVYVKPNHDVMWVYHRGEKGDIEVWAETLDEVIQTLREHGFSSVDISKIRRG